MERPNTKLEAARLKRRWSVEVASSKVGISVNTFNRWERGIQMPQLETLDLLCKAFAMSPEELGFEHVISAKRRGKVSLEGSDELMQHEGTELHPNATSLITVPSRESLLIPQSNSLIEDRTSTALEQTKEHEGVALHERLPGNKGKEMSRRQAMTFLISTPATIFGLTQERQSALLHPEEILALSRVNIPLCWELYFEGGLSELEQILPGYLTQLTTLAQSSSRYSQQAAALASQVHQLAYLLALQSQDFGKALKHTYAAASYGQQAEDVNLRVTALVRQAYIYFCLRRSAQRIYIYEEALRYSGGCSPLIQGYLYAGLAEAYANKKDRDAALEMLERANTIFPERPEDDAHFAYTHFRWPTIHNLEGLVHLHLEQAGQAWRSFHRVDQAVTQAIVPHRVEVTVYQAATALRLDELEQSRSLLTTAVDAAIKLGSHLRYQEASLVYDQMQERWPREPQIKTLQELFR